VLLGELDRATQRFGLAAPSGIVSHTGIGGLTLGGGLGHTMRRFGLTVDHLVGVDLVTADAERLHVDAWTEPELFWGLRGGGGNFGIATAFTYRLHPVGPIVLGGPIFWPLADAGEVLGFLRDFAPQAPDELGVAMFARLAPPGPLVPPEQYSRPVLGLVPVWAGDPAEGQRALAPLRRVGRPVADSLRPLPYLFLQSMVDGGQPARHALLLAVPAGPRAHRRRDRRARRADRRHHLAALLHRRVRHGRRRRPGRPRRHRRRRARQRVRAQHRRRLTAARPDGERHVAWVRRGATSLQPDSRGVYSHFLSDEGAAGVEAAYGDRLKRLTALKDRWDPTNLFRMNANIPPSAPGRR
jgi:FAD/FMN-containing dehydrogenase